MIPKLHIAVNDDITSMRCIGRIDRARECICKRTINGEYTLEITTDIADFTALNITTLKFISAKPNPFDDEQYFIISKVERTIDGLIKFTAEHIAFLCNQIITHNLTIYADEKENLIENTTAAGAWYVLINSYLPNGFKMPFSFSSQVNTRADFWLGTAKAETFGNIMSNNEGGF
ncbi:MAG: hypothetical protein VZS12_09170 [Ruminococcus bromii]|nr:hypothetical protein [Ruminococcus bromii]